MPKKKIAALESRNETITFKCKTKIIFYFKWFRKSKFPAKLILKTEWKNGSIKLFIPFHVKLVPFSENI